MNNTSTVNNQQYLAQEENNQTSFFSKNIVFLGIPIPFWLLSLCLIVIILLVIFYIPDTTFTEVNPDYDFTIPSESPRNTIIDNILRKNY